MEQHCTLAFLERTARLKALELPRQVRPDRPMVPEVYFSWDRADGDAAITLEHAGTGLLRARIEVTGTPSWLTFNIGLGSCRIVAGNMLGLLAQTGIGNAPDGTPIRIFPLVRSIDRFGHLDTPLSGDLTLGAGAGVWSLLHRIRERDPMAAEETYHTLILPLPRRDLTLDLVDLRLFAASGGI